MEEKLVARGLGVVAGMQTVCGIGELVVPGSG